MVAGISTIVSFVSVSILLALTVLPPPKRATPPLPFPQLSVREGFCFGKVFVIEVDNANRLDVWVGEQMRGKQRMGDHALAIARKTSASAVMTTSFHWWTGKGFIVLGQVIQDGESIVSPNEDVLRWYRCFFGSTWDGRFLIGETNLTMGKLLQQLPQIRHLVGGGGWLVKSGDPTAWKLATKQGFRSDITCSRRQRIAVGVSANGEKAWLALFAGRVSLQECAEWIHQNLPIHNAIFFDGGRNAVLVTRDEHENAWKIQNGLTILPETPCLLIVR